MSFLSVTYYYCLNILLSLPLVIICIYFYFFVLFWYVSVNFNTNTISITVFSVGVLFCLHSNVYYVSIVHCNGFILYLPHIIPISAMTPPLPIHCYNCRICKLDCNAALNVKGLCIQCHVDGVECLPPPPLILSSTVRPLIMVVLYSRRIASSAL